MATKSQIARFEKAQAAYRAAVVKFDEIDSAYSIKYGSSYQPTWLSTGERSRIHKARAAVCRASARVFSALEHAPRNWMSGVPSHWVCRDLTTVDAFRPRSEPLSVQPPLAYAAAAAMR